MALRNILLNITFAGPAPKQRTGFPDIVGCRSLHFCLISNFSSLSPPPSPPAAPAAAAAGRSPRRGGSRATGGGSRCCRVGRSGRRAASARRGCPPRRSRPGRSTMMRSACWMVERRWAMTIAVRSRQHHVQPLLDLRLGQRVDAGGGLVQNDDRRVLQQHPRQRHQLPLAQREAAPALAHLASASRPAAPRASRRRRSAAPPPPPRRRWPPGGHSGCCRPPCRRRGTAPAARCPGGGGSRAGRSVRMSRPSIRSCAALELVEARHQLAQRRLARAGVPDQRHGLARPGSSG